MPPGQGCPARINSKALRPQVTLRSRHKCRGPSPTMIDEKQLRATHPETGSSPAANAGSEHLVQARLAAIVESCDDAIVGKTLDGIVTSWNTGAQRLFGYSPDEIIGKSILLIVPPERREEEAMILGRLCTGERIDHFETQRVRKSGERVEVSLTVSPIRDERGTIVGASKVARDISERHRIQGSRTGLKRLCRDPLPDSAAGKNVAKTSAVGAKELSPALQRWVRWGIIASPVGTAEVATQSLKPNSLRTRNGAAGSHALQSLLFTFRKQMITHYCSNITLLPATARAS